MSCVNPSNSFTTRKTLLLRIKPDAPEKEVAWREFNEMYAPIIGGFARKMGAKPHDIADVVQDVLTGFFAAVPTFVYDPARGRFRGYLKTCTFRAVRDRLGKQLRFGGRGLDEIDPSEYQVEATWNDVWQHEQLHRALEIVRERYRQSPVQWKTFRAFEMCAMLGQSPKDVATELEMPEASVYQAKSRVSKAIKAAMDQLEEDAG